MVYNAPKMTLTSNVKVDIRIPMPKKAKSRKFAKSTTKMKKTTPPKDTRPSFKRNPELYIDWETTDWTLRWYTLARNWPAEYRLRIQTQIFNPDTNPDTKTSYSPNAQRYRENFIQRKFIPRKG
jgi:hypothetical protein